MMRFAVSDRDLDIASLRRELHNPHHGGFCAFEGWVRDRNEGRAVGGLEYEIYAELAHTEGERILQEARERFGAIDAVGIHRSGMLRIGELAVWVGVSSAHRHEAFRACRFIIDQIKHRLPVWKKEHYLEGDTAWVACAHPGEDHGHTHHHPVVRPTFTPDYSRQKRLPSVGEAGQETLAAARVLVIGAGGLGSPVLSYLAGAGVGALGISDDDSIEASNLHRQILFTVADLGRSKTEVAAERIAAVNPAVRTETFGRIVPEEAVALFRRFDLVVECSDDPASRFLCSDAAVLAGTPAILASVHQYEGQLQVIDPRVGGPCLRCLWAAEPAPETATSCAESGVLGPVPGVLGAMQANEALKLLLGLPRQPPDTLLLVDLLDNRTDQLRINAEDGCTVHGGCVAVAERAMAARRSADLERSFPSLDAACAAGYRVVDVRNEDERATLPMPEAAHFLPLPLLLEPGVTVPEEGPLLLVCASGRRSARGALHVRQAGRSDVFTLRGGLQGLAGRGALS